MAPQADDVDDPYTITSSGGGGGETRIDITGDSVKDPALVISGSRWNTDRLFDHTR